MANRRKFIRELTMAAGAVSFLRPLQVFAGVGATGPTTSARTFSLTLLHTANLNGQWASLPSSEMLAGLGGLRNLTKKIHEIKRTTDAVLLHSGNITGTHHGHGAGCLPYYRELGKAGYDVLAPGADDSVADLETYRQLAQEGKLPASAQAVDGLLSHKLVRKAGLQIGIIEMPQQAASNTAAAASWLNKTAAHLRNAQHCNLVLCNLPSASTDARMLASLLTGVDVLLCATEQSVIYNCVVVKSEKGDEVILSYPGPKGTMISRLDFAFDESLQKTGFSSNAIFIGAAQQTTVALMKRYRLSYA